MNPKDTVLPTFSKAHRASTRKAYAKRLIAGGMSRSVALKKAKAACK